MPVRMMPRNGSIRPFSWRNGSVPGPAGSGCAGWARTSTGRLIDLSRMRLDRSHFPWAFFTLLFTGLAAVLYLAARHDDPNQPFRLFGLAVSLPDYFRDAAHRRNTVGAKPMGLAFGI